MPYIPATLHKKIRSHLALLVDPTTMENGSGVLVRINNRVFIVTAAHVLSGNIHINLGSPWQESPFTILDRWTDDALDVGFLELKPFEVEILRHDDACAYRISSVRSTEIPTKINNLALCGYPTVCHIVSDHAIMYTPAFFATTLVHPANWPAFLRERGKTPESNIALSYSEKGQDAFYDSDGNPLQIAPRGLSGCGIWYFDPQTKDAENPTYSLVAIQNSYSPQHRLVVGTFVQPIIDTICSHYGFSLHP